MVIETQSPPSQNSQNIEDINSPHRPLFFHLNDHPSLFLISKKLLGSENYETWRRSLLIALSAKNKLKLINGEYEEPDPNYEFRAYWERANDMLISWILNTISEQIGKENGEREQRKRLIQFLMGLDECYTNIRGQILLMQPLPTAAKAYSMLRQEEKQRDTHKQPLNAPIALNNYRTPYNALNNSSY
ncbi:cysteine-rich receptor-like protein kinase 8, partial [Tanacetum coccineum]